MKNLKKCNATILIITLWVLTLLSAIALSVTYRMRLELKLVDIGLNREKAFYAAMAGVTQAIAVLNQNTKDYDSLTEPWSDYNENLYGINLFKDIQVGEGTFNIKYVYETAIFSGQHRVFYGMVDEERKININKATQDVLECLGISSEIVTSIRAWRGDADVPQDILLKEDAYYQSLPKPYKRKGKPFEFLDELVLVHGVTPELLYGKDLDGDGTISMGESGLSKYITVYGDGLVNINTAGEIVLRALDFTEDLSIRIIRYRYGMDGELGTSDDFIFTDVSNIAGDLNRFEPITPEEEGLINKKKELLKVASRYYTAYIEGTVGSKACCRLAVVLDKDSAEGNQITRWEEE